MVTLWRIVKTVPKEDAREASTLEEESDCRSELRDLVKWDVEPTGEEAGREEPTVVKLRPRPCMSEVEFDAGVAVLLFEDESSSRLNESVSALSSSKRVEEGEQKSFIIWMVSVLPFPGATYSSSVKRSTLGTGWKPETAAPPAPAAFG